jgi:hypothetical protein
MAINPFSEELLTLSEVAKYCPRHRRGKKPHTSTLYRWATHGSQGILLEALKTPGGWVTTKEALRRFFLDLTNANPMQKQANETDHDEHFHKSIENELFQRFKL